MWPSVNLPGAEGDGTQQVQTAKPSHGPAKPDASRRFGAPSDLCPRSGSVGA